MVELRMPGEARRFRRRRPPAGTRDGGTRIHGPGRRVWAALAVAIARVWRTRVREIAHLRGWAAIGPVLALLLGACLPDAEFSVGHRVPAYAAEDLDGEQVALRDLRGDVVVLNVWATWCYPCRREMPTIEALHRELAPYGLRVVAVSIDGDRAAREIRRFVEEYELGFTILHDPGQQVTRDFRTRGVPETFLIDREGRLIRHWVGLIDARSDAVRGPVLAALRGEAVLPHASP